jgi:hypothetical protein
MPHLPRFGNARSLPFAVRNQPTVATVEKNLDVYYYLEYK